MSRFQRFDLHQLARKERCQLALLCFALCLRFWSAHAAAFKQSEPRSSGHSVSLGCTLLREVHSWQPGDPGWARGMHGTGYFVATAVPLGTL
jgi:hypothetical protein